jgi:uncharacterized membrane protein
MTSTLNIAAILCIGLMIGAEFAVSAFVNPVLRKLDDRTRLAVIRLFAAKLGFAMPFWYGLGFLLLLTETFLRRHQPQFTLLALSTGIWAAVIVLTLLFLVPINNRLAQLSPETADAREALQQHARWDSMHRIRVAALMAAWVLFLLALQI